MIKALPSAHCVRCAQCLISIAFKLHSLRSSAICFLLLKRIKEVKVLDVARLPPFIKTFSGFAEKLKQGFA